MSIPVLDPFHILADARMPFLAHALDPTQVRLCLVECCPDLVKGLGQIEIRGIRVVRYKPERRCLIEYELGHSAGSLTVLGKVRAKGLDRKTFELQQALWSGPFGPQSEDGIQVPEPLGVIPPLQMWLQAKVPGVAATELLAKPAGVELSRRMAEAIYKLHGANVPAHRTHTLGDELRILRERLALVRQTNPAWDARLERLLDACARLGASVPEPRVRGIHRDFYPAQVMVDGRQLYLLDFDLFCGGNPALDVGNFAGHLTEQGLRVLGHPEALAECENALTERFLELTGEELRTAVTAYTTFTLVRHIYLSTQFPDRRRFTKSLIELCEGQLSRFLEAH